MQGKRKPLSSKHRHLHSNVIQLVTLLWIIEIINALLGHRLNSWGIFPRTADGLVGIFFSPLLHTSIVHLALNTMPIVILGLLIHLLPQPVFWRTTLYIILVGGLLLWVFGRPAYHVGASGLIFGYFGFLVFRGIFNLSIGSLLLSFVTLFFYGGLFWQMLPALSKVSWEGHLCGFIAGILAARTQRRSNQNRSPA